MAKFNCKITSLEKRTRKKRPVIDIPFISRLQGHSGQEHLSSRAHDGRCAQMRGSALIFQLERPALALRELP